MQYKKNSIWDVEIDAFMSLENRFRNLYDSGIEKIYI